MDGFLIHDGLAVRGGPALLAIGVLADLITKRLP
jgi:hypothetical protein